MMKKIVAVLLVSILLLCAAGAMAENEADVFGALTALMNGRQFTLTVEAEGTDEAADFIARYGKVTCTLFQQDNQILLNAACEGDAFLNAVATAEDVRITTNLIENGEISCAWAELLPNVSLTRDEKGNSAFTVGMTGPDHELINFSCKVSGSDPADCEIEIHIGFITGPGNVHSLWDGYTNQDGETSREFYFSFSEEEYAIESEGTVNVETAEDGAVTITRDESGDVLHNEDEIGTVTIHSVLTIK